MSLYSRIAQFFHRERLSTAPARAGYSPRQGQWEEIIGPGQAQALQIATVYRCIKLLCDSVANLPLQYMRLRDGIFVEDRGSRLWYLLNVQPDRAINAFDFWRRIVQLVLIDGNAYIVPVYDDSDMEISRLVLCDRYTVSHDSINDLYTISDIRNGICGTYAEDEIIHIKGLAGNDSKKGVSVLTYARHAMNIANAGDRETYTRFADGGGVRGLVSDGSSIKGFGALQDAQLTKMARSIDGSFQKGERIVSLPGQVDFKQLTLSSTDMQFLESRKFTVREICRFFGVHPTFVYDDTSNNYKSAEQANVAFLSHTLAPMLRSIEIELLRKLTAPALCGKRKFEFKKQGLYACDLDGLMKYRASLLQTGTTVNEIRHMDNLPPVEGGNTVLVSANLRGINDQGNSAGVGKRETEQTDKDDKNSNEE
ncbi:MAG: phage portal protein [Bacteroidales bacterium]|nr:phage portal protein [Bacteroidales bacterium]